MSTILKALRRLEQERSLEQSHSLRERVVGGLSDPPRRSGGLRIALLVTGGLVSAAAGGLAFTVWMQAGNPEAPAVAAAATQQTAPRAMTGSASLANAAPQLARSEWVAAETPRPTPPAVDVAAYRPPPPTPFVRPVAGPPASRQSGRQGAVSGEPSVNPANAATAPEPEPKPDWVAGAGSWSDGFEEEIPATLAAASGVNDQLAPGSALDSGRAGEPAVVARQISDPDSQVAAVGEFIEFAEDVALVSHQPPTPPQADDLSRPAPESALSRQVEHSLPVVRRAKVPSVEVVQTIWHPRSERRQAVLRIANQDELVRLSEGDAVGPLVLLEIQPAGVVFDHDGLQIQRRVGAQP